FLAHIVCPATTGLTDTAAHHQHIDEAAVVHIHVVPVVQRRAHNYHGTTTGFVGITGEFTGNPDHISTVYTGNHFLPGRSVRHIVIKAAGTAAVADAVIHTIMRQHQVEYSRYLSGATGRQLHGFNRYFAQLNITVFSMLAILIFVRRTTKIRERHFGKTIILVFQGQHQIHFTVAVFLLQVPLTFFTPAITNGTIRAG